MIAAEQGNLEIVKELIKNGANCNLEDLVYIKIIYFFVVLVFSTTLLFVFEKGFKISRLRLCFQICLNFASYPTQVCFLKG